jgi:hypothetical protein
MSLPQIEKEKKPLEQIFQPKPTPTEEIHPAQSMNRKFFLFFDFAFNNREGIKKSREAALHFIDTKLHPTDEVGLLSYSLLNSLSLHEFLTKNHQKVREAVEGIGMENVLGHANNVEEQFWRNTLKLSAPDASEYAQPLDNSKFQGPSVHPRPQTHHSFLLRNSDILPLWDSHSIWGEQYLSERSQCQYGR